MMVYELNFLKERCKREGLPEHHMSLFLTGFGVLAVAVAVGGAAAAYFSRKKMG